MYAKQSGGTLGHQAVTDEYARPQRPSSAIRGVNVHTETCHAKLVRRQATALLIIIIIIINRQQQQQQQPGTYLRRGFTGSNPL